VTAARTPPDVPAGGLPVSILLDFDGTISLLDVGDKILARHGPPAEVIARKDALYDAGVIGSRELVRWDLDVLPEEPELLLREAAGIPLDHTLVGLVEHARSLGAAVEVVSDGFGFHLEPALASLGLVDVPVATNHWTMAGGGAGLSFPYGHPRCFVCGTCKRERVRAHHAIGRAVVFVGDGTSDRYACAHADVVFAKGSLADWCRREGWPFRPWSLLSDVADWFVGAANDGGLPASSDELADWRARCAPPQPRRFVCGPEIWGPDRSVPLATAVTMEP
jgi:2-hydroxy-3-keto-5-methylthiopentenyl-1-phosphate phosphatase